MNTALCALFIVAIIPFLLSFTGGYLRHKEFGQVDNKNPRAQYAQAKGIAARAYAAQQNAWEALALFTAALFVATTTGANPENVAIASIVYVVARVLHALFYLIDKDMLRSLAFFVGLVSAIALFFLG